MKWQATALHATDNVATALRPIAAGESVCVLHGALLVEIMALEAIPLCHKIALTDIREGDAVLKYGQCIGDAVGPIARGAMVHTHNLRSRRARQPGRK